MSFIETKDLATDALKEFDNFMTRTTVEIEPTSAIAYNVWSNVLKELDKRGEVTLISGSYDNIGNALIRRLWLTA